MFQVPENEEGMQCTPFWGAQFSYLPGILASVKKTLCALSEAPAHSCNPRNDHAQWEDRHVLKEGVGVPSKPGEASALNFLKWDLTITYKIAALGTSKQSGSEIHSDSAPLLVSTSGGACFLPRGTAISDKRVRPEILAFWHGPEGIAKPLHTFARLPICKHKLYSFASFHIKTGPEINAFLNQDSYRFSRFCQSWFQKLMLVENVSAAADRPGSRAVGQPLVTPYKGYKGKRPQSRRL
eukprot:1143513-Pelagomonas_calceolata.AAC.1